MDDQIIKIGSERSNPPATREECQQRLAVVKDEIAAIRTEIAAADMDRQAGRGKMDARWFHRARTALRHRQSEAAHLAVLMSRLPGRKDALKDMLIVLFRESHDDAAWAAVMDEAHRRLREVA